jgi:hypothetical protein
MVLQRQKGPQPRPFLMRFARVRTYPEDEYQACSGEALVAAKKALTKGGNAAGAKARLYFMAFTARLKSCPDTKRQRIHTFAWMPEIV